MTVSVGRFLSDFGDGFEALDLNVIQQRINLLSEETERTKFKKDPNGHMIGSLTSVGMKIPEGLHFHWDNEGVLVPGEDDDVVSEHRLVLGASPNSEFQLIAAGNVTIKGSCNGCILCFVINL